MLLAPNDARSFFKLHHSLMCFVNTRLQIVPEVATPDEFSTVSPEMRLKVREGLVQMPNLLEEFVSSNPFALTDEELVEVASWRYWAWENSLCCDIWRSMPSSWRRGNQRLRMAFGRSPIRSRR